MEPKMTFTYTLTARHCINDIATHLRRAGLETRSIIADILGQFEKIVGQFPLGSQICPELIKIGCAKYREFNHADGYRVLYSVEGTIVTAHAILAHRQDVQQLLFKRLIMV
ncbi:type II toxin-antitoxin system RelE/ParE family toxin [Citrobacter sp. ku-bf4]|uniref:type II toxin-antitoxin system RelE/ParE family toxin n=1 Tax=Citrobacter TaxID=544 RepID=UPI00197EFCF2|nr:MULTISPECIES: type II toxin-antitoxin system RelE/ParE family toxin [Citrobacter]MBN6044251.1 type II toxin-antitoxin system RelE/ParE family toxin [Citrobacter sp. ku-bf4]MBS0825628.1 type II toxin-antitoxin system RelE/ParE family toxin [Citrobacter amalonaticus]